MAGPSVVNISTEYRPKQVRSQAIPRRRGQAAPPDDDQGGQAAAERTIFFTASLAAVPSAGTRMEVVQPTEALGSGSSRSRRLRADE